MSEYGLYRAEDINELSIMLIDIFDRIETRLNRIEVSIGGYSYNYDWERTFVKEV